MTIFKCKMCGGALEINNNETVATCEYCGTQQTLPKLDDDKRANMYDRANHFRRNNEFDKAMGIYEQILNEDNTDAEAYWSLVLCRYGIEYVEDPSSHKRVPTVNRAQFTSIFDDDNYKSALQYADGYQRTIYEEEAKAINEIQKGILAISQKEEPFDVFICYKETDEAGRRTPDSVLANDLYHQLTQEGFKVFFARITLEDKLGSAYEPYIFAALNSSKVMVVLGTKPEFFKAVWVKNEWSRYLSLIKNGADKMLIPAYKDMDPYDLPEEFSHLQAQDMSKLGFMQDLIRGIKKITKADEPAPAVIKETVVSSTSSSTEPLLKRAFMFLEDGDFEGADEYCEKVLDLDPECAEAYLGKLMAELRVNKQENLKNCEKPFNDRNNYQKALRFAEDSLKAVLVEYIEYINKRNEQRRLEGTYEKASNCFSLQDEESLRKATKLFESISGYKDSAELARKSFIKAEEIKNEHIYQDAKTYFLSGVLHYLQKAAKLFESISGYKDSAELAEKSLDRVKKVQRKAELLDTLSKIEEAKKKKHYAIEPLKAEEQMLSELKEEWPKIKAELEKYTNESKIAEEKVRALEKERSMLGFFKGKRRNEINNEIERLQQQIALLKDKITALEPKKQGYESFENICNNLEVCQKRIASEENQQKEMKELLDPSFEKSIMDELDLLEQNGNKSEKVNQEFKQKSEKIQLTESFKSSKIGDVIRFGHYPQTGTEKEDIEWLVLEKQEAKLLVISKYGLDCKEYNESYTDVTWETCTLRKWLNNDFLGSAFSANEKAVIPTVTVEAHANPQYNTNPGNATQDQVFLLSITEANKYFSSESARQCKATDYAVANGWEESSGNYSWWLRSPGSHQQKGSCVYVDGSFDNGGDIDFVRPAMWIDLK
ncbi:MAG: TIR domain-containing protein [Ruminococcaceae bacterium]|nr:TIR domain-containing protein [Oscillospiraceae bacterium]